MHKLENMAINKVMGKFVVVNAEDNTIKSPKYDDEAHALRYIKFLTNFKKDWRELKVKRLYQDEANIGGS